MTRDMLRSGPTASWVARMRSASLESGPEIIPTSTRSTPVRTSRSAMRAASSGPNSTPAMWAESLRVASDTCGSLPGRPSS